MSNPKLKVSLASVILVSALLVLFVSLQGDLLPEVRAQGPCNAASLHGSYGISFHFLNTNPNSVGTPIGISTHTPGAGVGIVEFDGRGHYVEQATISISGLILQVPASGTYGVNPNCTGSRVINFADGSTATVDFVIVDHGREIHELATRQGDIAVGVLKKQF